MYKQLFILLILYSIQLQGQAAPSKRPLTVTTVGADTRLDTRFTYEYRIVKLALEKTVLDFGPYILNSSPSMTQTRAAIAIRDNIHTNFIRTFGYEYSLIDKHNMELIPYPIFKGVLGLRTCFLSKKIRQAFANANTLEELKQFSHGQGIGWADRKILSFNGFEAVEFPDYESLFKMVARGRFDLFCRGAHDVLDEYHRFRSIPNFSYDRTKAFYYDFPHFLYTNKNNKETVARVSKGLQIAMSDGSLDALWESYHMDSIRFSGMENRKIIFLENQLMKGLDVDYRQYFYPPLLKLISINN